jgi:AcrR family transcriptional regulator
MDKSDIRAAALLRFSQQGYHATTLRQLADDLGVTPAAFYYYYSTKDELLTELVEGILARDLSRVKEIRATSGDSLDAMIYNHVRECCTHQVESLVVAHDTKSLPPRFRTRVHRLVREYEDEFAACIAAEYGLEGDAQWLATKAVLGMGQNVTQWYRSDGPQSPEVIAEEYTRYARGLLQAAKRRAASRRGRRQTAHSAD